MKDDNATIEINANRDGSSYSISTQLSHADGLKVLVYVMNLMDAQVQPKCLCVCHRNSPQDEHCSLCKLT